MISGATRVYALVGRPVAHSLSPAIYNALFAADGIDAVYVALDVAPEQGHRVADAMRTLGLAGVNLTVPHKAAVVPYLDYAQPIVGIAGAANVVVQDEGRLLGDNTDGEGFCRAWEEAGGSFRPGGRAVLLGAGGAARAIAAAVADRGLSEVVFLNRTLDTARSHATHLARWLPGVKFSIGPLEPEAFAAVGATADLVVNATPAAGRAAVAALDPGVLPDRAGWVDLNYWDPDPPGMAACNARGLRTQGGLDMLVHQAALAYARFTGQVADPALIRSRLADRDADP